MKNNNICILGTPGEEREQGMENLFEEMTENFPNVVKEKDTEIQEGQRVLNNLREPKKTTLRHIIKLARLKLKTRRES